MPGLIRKSEINLGNSYKLVGEDDYLEMSGRVGLDAVKNMDYKNYTWELNKLTRTIRDNESLLKEFEQDPKKMKSYRADFKEYCANDLNGAKKLFELFKVDERYADALETIERLNSSSDEMAWDNFMGFWDREDHELYEW